MHKELQIYNNTCYNFFSQKTLDLYDISWVLKLQNRRKESFFLKENVVDIFSNAGLLGCRDLDTPMKTIAKLFPERPGGDISADIRDENIVH